MAKSASCAGGQRKPIGINISIIRISTSIMIVSSSSSSSNMINCISIIIVSITSSIIIAINTNGIIGIIITIIRKPVANCPQVRREPVV